MGRLLLVEVVIWTNTKRQSDISIAFCLFCIVSVEKIAENRLMSPIVVFSLVVPDSNAYAFR